MVGFHKDSLGTSHDIVRLFLPVGGVLIALGVHLALPNVYPQNYIPQTYTPVLLTLLGIYVVTLLVGIAVQKVRRFLNYWAPWFLAVALILTFLDICTLKTGIFNLPFMPSPDKIMATYGNYSDEILSNLFDSLVRLFIGLAIGGVVGFFSGLMMGWSKLWDYWMAPILKFIGPLPAAAWIPIAVTVMPTPRVAGIFLIAIAMWFPLTLMLSSGIKATPRKQIESARVLGASESYILFKVALPSAMNAIFTGMFMGLSSSFSALLVAETMGVSAGLGWYINWSTSWADYGRVFAVIGIFIVLFFLLIQILFTIRDHVMKWQEGVVKW